MIDYPGLATRLAGGPLADWAATLPGNLAHRLSRGSRADMGKWCDAIDALPAVAVSSVELEADAVRAGVAEDCDEPTRLRLEDALRALSPWRKGPFEVCGTRIDSEWRSDLKWNRLAGAIAPLEDRTVLDVGCGSGYHAWRMAGMGARTVVGVEPMPLYVLQFCALRRYLGDRGVFVLPLRMEEMPRDRRAFDTVFSMGVLYHRRSPLDHLADLRGALVPGGQLVLETLIVEGTDITVLVPRNRYARMRNVWFIPSVEMLCTWLARSGFTNITLVDITATTPEEQRRTRWMPLESLAESLDPADPGRTVEGYPAPLRAILTANAR